MAIWMDMTNSLQTWKGGVVGIVRAELEIAKNMKRCDPDVRFFRFNGSAFEEVGEHELEWLWTCESVGDAYLTAMGRKQTSGLEGKGGEESVEELRKVYPGLDNAYRYSGSRLHRAIWGLLLYANTLPAGIRGFTKGAITLVAAPLKKISLWRARCKAAQQAQAAQASKEAQRSSPFFHPFGQDDLIFSCGWLYSGKEEGFEKVKEELPSIFITYLIYDIILIRENTKHFYDVTLSADFETYLKWVSMHCDAILYGGKTAMEDTQSYQSKHHLPVPPGYPVYFGSNIMHTAQDGSTVFDKFCQENGIERAYIMAVGSLDERKNYATLYRAMTILADHPKEPFPRLVIVGKGGSCKILQDTIQRDPRTAENIVFVSPTDEELDQLYRNAAFVVLASAWEGWSLTLPEALQYGKFVIASDVPPLQEIGGGFIDYVDPYDPLAWSEKISYYYNHPEERRCREETIRSSYTPIYWSDCGQQINGILRDLNRQTRQEKRHSLYMDLTLTCCTILNHGKITGIMRSELMLAKWLYRLYPRIKFFSIFEQFGFLEIDVSTIAPILTGDNLDLDFLACQDGVVNRYFSIPTVPVSNINNSYASKRDAFWFLTSVFPLNWQKKLITLGKKKKDRMDAVSSAPSLQGRDGGNLRLPFSSGDVVFTAGTGFDEKVKQTLLTARKEIGFKYVSIVYDFTPILLPQVHQNATIEHYIPFLDFISNMSDLILYGGETARKDGIAYQKKAGLPIPLSAAIKFGSDISQCEDTEPYQDGNETKAVLKRLGIKGPYVLSVGTLEIRKNHETLYRAYLRMLERDEDIPQMVFAGHRGWKTEDFVGTLSRDERVKGKILWITPTDEELSILYQNCEFTILASLYEGWSLTLPESFWYGKFCLCCDTPALKETAGALSEYVQAWDEKTWSERICYYHSHPQALADREKAIMEHWHPISWEECAGHVLSKLEEVLYHEQG